MNQKEQKSRYIIECETCNKEKSGEVCRKCILDKVEPELVIAENMTDYWKCKAAGLE